MPNNILSCKKEDFFHLAETILKQGNCIKFKAEGGSMSPSIRSGDIVEVAPVTDEITSGDIILYRSRENTPVVHRVIKKTESGGVLTKGDSSFDFDSPLVPDQVLGKVMAVERRGFSIRPFLSEILCWIQSFKLYRILARTLFKSENIQVIQAEGMDLLKLKNLYQKGGECFSDECLEKSFDENLPPPKPG